MRSITSNKSTGGLLVLGVLSMVIAGFLFIMGLVILDETMISSIATTQHTTFNESATDINAVDLETCGNASKCGFNNFVITSITNATGDAINSSNYTILSDRICTYQLTTGGESDPINGTTALVSYTYLSGEGAAACDSSENTIEGQGTFGDYFDLLAIAIIIAVVMGLIIGIGVRKFR